MALCGETAIVTVTGIDGIIQSVDKGCCTMFGYEMHELPGKPIKILVPTPYKEQHDSYLDNYHRTGKAKIVGKVRSLEGQHKDGTIFPIRLSVSEVKTGTTTSIYIGMIQKLQDTAAIITTDMKGKILTVNQFCESLWGFTTSELIGENVRILMPNPHKDKHDTYLENYFKTGKRKVIGKVRNVAGQHKNGLIFPICLQVERIKVNEVEYFRGRIERVEEEKEAVFTLDNGGIILSCNGNFVLPLLGYSNSELQGRHINILMPKLYTTIVNDSLLIKRKRKIDLPSFKKSKFTHDNNNNNDNNNDDDNNDNNNVDNKNEDEKNDKNNKNEEEEEEEEEEDEEEEYNRGPSLCPFANQILLPINNTINNDISNNGQCTKENYDNNNNNNNTITDSNNNNDNNKEGDGEGGRGSGGGCPFHHMNNNNDNNNNNIDNNIDNNKITITQMPNHTGEEAGESLVKGSFDFSSPNNVNNQSALSNNSDNSETLDEWCLSGTKFIECIHRDGSCFTVALTITKFDMDGSVRYSCKVRRLTSEPLKNEENEGGNGRSDGEYGSDYGDYSGDSSFNSIRSSSLPKVNSQFSIGKFLFSTTKTIGAGSYGKVFMGENTENSQKVAVKILQKDIMDDIELERSKREIEIMKKLRHPNICRLYDSFETTERIYIVMEFCPNGELFTYVNSRGKLNESESRNFFLQLIDGIKYCHSNNVIHRDIKHKNILLDENLVLKIIDFGLSNFTIDGGFRNTFCGTPAYSAPEMILARQYVGPEVDVWSMGVVLFSMLFGEFPFKTVSDIINGNFRIPNNTVSNECGDAIKKMLQVDPNNRITVDDLLSHPFVTGVKLTSEVTGPNIRNVQCLVIDADQNPPSM